MTLDRCINAMVEDGLVYERSSHNEDVYYTRDYAGVDMYLRLNCSETFYNDVIDEDEDGVLAVLIYRRCR